VLHLATAEAFTQPAQVEMEETPLYYPLRQAELEVTPHKGWSEQTQALTWSLWITTLSGLEEFTLAYPGLWFTFEIFVTVMIEGGIEEEFWLGKGLLGPR